MLFFYLKDCPYCKDAMKWIEECKKENPLYQDISITMIEENQQKEIADMYDYYYVPCFFEGKKKIHEGIMDKEMIKNIFEDNLRRKK